MKKVFIGAAIIVGGVILFFLLRPVEPKYRGRTISAWQDDWAAKKSRDFPVALGHVGTNALPYAVRNLALNDSWWRTNYSRIQPKLPYILQRLFQKPKPLLDEVDGANVFFYLGSNSIPQAVALLKHPSPTVRRAAACGLGSLRRQSPAADQAIPGLIGALTDEDRMVRFNAAGALTEMGADASNAVPGLTKVVADTGVGAETNSFFYVRAVAAVALGKIGPAATSALPTLKAALQESNSYLRGQSAVAIWRIAADADTALPVLLREMPATSQHSKWDWIIALGEMGPRAKQAIPQLRTELEKDQQEWVLAYVTNAIKSIAPEAATGASEK
jgi:HEAT repeat protein